ncbi:hypothetical protein D3C79_1015520 [compost metagenome]
MAGSVVLTAAAWLGKASGNSRPARTRGRSVLIMIDKYPTAREKGIGAVRDDGPRVKEYALCPKRSDDAPRSTEKHPQ